MTTDTETPTPEPGGIADLRERADRVGPLEAEKTALVREMAFMRAGIDTSTDLGATLMRGYDGELTTEALQPLAAQMAALAPPAPSLDAEGNIAPAPTPAPMPDAPRVVDPPSPLAAMEAAGGGLAPGLTPPVSLVDQGWASFRERLDGGANPEDAAAELVNRVIDGAVREQNGEAGYTGFLYNQAEFHRSGN